MTTKSDLDYQLINIFSQIPIEWPLKCTTGSYPSFKHAFIYRGGKMTDLNTVIDPASGWELIDAIGINDTGWITGGGFVSLIPGGHKLYASFLAIPCAGTLC